VLANAGSEPPGAVLRVAAFVDRDGPGYGPAAEAHGGWAARHDPPRLARTSVADPVAGLVGAVTAVGLLRGGERGARARVSLEGAVGRLLERERRGG
jgi:crotonobetainyl-CoA:carnitine CoA-transferase CaiB-like acyl-CoA transferase